MGLDLLIKKTNKNINPVVDENMQECSMSANKKRGHSFMNNHFHNNTSTAASGALRKVSCVQIEEMTSIPSVAQLEHLSPQGKNRCAKYRTNLGNAIFGGPGST